MTSIKNIKVSVCVVTYNQDKYIAECLQSLVDQETDFAFEIIVGDDFSKDDTRKVIEDFAERYPDIVKPVYNLENLGATKNYFNVHRKAIGDYVFHMDGDDLAYPGKLQTQADFLDMHEGVVCCWHRAQVFSNDGVLGPIREAGLNHIVDPHDITIMDFLKFGVLGCHSSLAYRRRALMDIKMLEGEVLDYYIAVHLLSKGKGVNISDVLGGYRLNPGAITASNKKHFLFKSSPLKKLYLAHLKYFSRKYPEYSDCIFFNCIYNFLVELSKFRLGLAVGFLRLAFRNISASALASLHNDFIQYRKACR